MFIRPHYFSIISDLRSILRNMLPFINQKKPKSVAWISSDYFKSLLLPQSLRGENDSKQSEEFQATKSGVLNLFDRCILKILIIMPSSLSNYGEVKHISWRVAKRFFYWMIFNIPYADKNFNNKKHAHEVSLYYTSNDLFWGDTIPTNSKYLQFIDNGIL